MTPRPSRRALLGAPAALAAAAAVGSVEVASVAGSADALALAGPAHQSPVDIRPGLVRRAAHLAPLRVHYPSSVPVSVRYVTKDQAEPGGGCSRREAEETEEVDVPAGAAHVTFRGTRYDLAQFHFHTPSEHTVEGRHAPLEMHLVHADATGHRLVVGVLLTQGRRSEPDRILRRLPVECADPIEVDDFDLASVVDRRPATLRYHGSLTTTPYSEGVHWFLTTPRTVSRRAIEAFQGVFTDGDSRDAQALHGRHLYADPGWSAAL